MKYLRLHHLIVYAGVIAGIVVGALTDTQPAVLGWLFGLGGGLAGGAFLAALVTGEPLAGGPSPAGGRRRGGGTTRPAWFDEDDTPSSNGHR